MFAPAMFAPQMFAPALFPPDFPSQEVIEVPGVSGAGGVYTGLGKSPSFYRRPERREEQRHEREARDMRDIADIIAILMQSRDL